MKNRKIFHFHEILNNTKIFRIGINDSHQFLQAFLKIFHRQITVKIVQIHQIDIVVVSDPIACKRPQSKPAINDSGIVRLVKNKI